MGRGLTLTLILTLPLTLAPTLPLPLALPLPLPLTRWAEGAPQPGDRLAVRYSPPRDACGVRALTGSAEGRDRCHVCRLSVCVEAGEGEAAEAGECVARDLGRLGRDGALEVRLVPPARLERVELRCEMTQDEWLIVRELGALPCDESPHDEL